MTRALCVVIAALLAGYTVGPPQDAEDIPPQVTPEPPTRVSPSLQSVALTAYYSNLETNLLARGLLRVDGGGPDTPFDADDLSKTFQKLVFFDEYGSDGFGSRASRESGQLRRWETPVRYSVEFGATVPAQRRDADRAEIRRFVDRLSRVTGHPITLSNREANFHVIVAGYDDRAEIEQRIRRLVPEISDGTLKALVTPPRQIQCLVAAFSDRSAPQKYTQAIAVIRDEHPLLIRRSCIHEELAQGLGISNDSPTARPSIFNDDDEFALLTTHDEYLLQMLYDPRLQAGLTLEEAAPTIRAIASETLGQNS